MSTQAAATSLDSASQVGTASGTQTASGATGSQQQTGEPKPVASMLAGGESSKEGQSAQVDKSKDMQSGAAGELTIKVPDGAKIDEAALSEFKNFAKEAGLTSESASKLVAWNLERTKAAEAEWQKQGESWFKELEADPDFGKAHLKESQQSVRRAVSRFFDDKLLSDLTSYGLDNHPGLIKALKRIGDTLKEDDSSTGSSPGNQAARRAADKDTQLRTDYPSMFKE